MVSRFITIMGCVILLFAPTFAAGQVTQGNQSESESDNVLRFPARQHIQHLVESARGSLSEEEYADWADPQKRSSLTREKAAQWIDRLAGRFLVGNADDIRQPALQSRIEAIACAYFAIGDFKSGEKALRNIPIVNFIEMGREQPGLNQLLSSLCIGLEDLPDELDPETQQRITRYMTRLAQVKSIESMESAVDIDWLIRLCDYLMRAGQFEAAAEICSKQRHAEFIAQNKSDWSIKDNYLGGVFILISEMQIQAELAQGKLESASEIFAEILRFRAEHAQNWWKSAGHDSPDAVVPEFDSLVGFSMAMARGPTLGDDSRIAPLYLGPFGAANRRGILTMKPELLSEEGRAAYEKLGASVYLESEAVEKALLEILKESDLNQHATCWVLRMLLIEMLLTNGKGQAAYDALVAFEDDWRLLQKKPRLDPSEIKLFETFFFGKRFPFEDYRGYLCTYFDNNPFRALCKYRKPWKRHERLFGFKREIPDHAKPPEPTPADRDRRSDRTDRTDGSGGTDGRDSSAGKGGSDRATGNSCLSQSRRNRFVRNSHFHHS